MKLSEINAIRNQINKHEKEELFKRISRELVALQEKNAEQALILEMASEIEILQNQLYHAEAKAYNETEDTIVRLEDKIEELESQKYESIEAWGSKVEKLSKENAQLRARLENKNILGRDKDKYRKVIREFADALIFDGHDIDLGATFYVNGEPVATLDEFTNLYLKGY